MQRKSSLHGLYYSLVSGAVAAPEFDYFTEKQQVFPSSSGNGNILQIVQGQQDRGMGILILYQTEKAGRLAGGQLGQNQIPGKGLLWFGLHQKLVTGKNSVGSAILLPHPINQAPLGSTAGQFRLFIAVGFAGLPKRLIAEIRKCLFILVNMPVACIGTAA